MSSSLDPALPPSYLSSPVMDPCRPNHSGLVAAPGHGYSSRGGVRWARRPLLDGAPVGFNPRRPHPEQVLAGTESPIEEAGDDDVILSQFSTDSIWDVEIVPDSMAEEVKIVPDSFVEEVDMVPDSMPEEVKIVPDSFIEEVDMVPDSLPEVKIVPDSLVEEVEMVPDSLPQEVDNKEVYEYDDCGNVIFTTELVHAFSEECHGDVIKFMLGLLHPKYCGPAAAAFRKMN